MLRILFSEAKKSTISPAIFIDRDGVINQRRRDGYVLDWSQFRFMPGIREALKQLSTLQLPIIVISNQAAVGRGLLNLDGLREITARMQQALLKDGTVLTAAYYCPHRSEEQCCCRKPKPGLLFAAARDFDIDLTRSVFIGDSTVDVKAAQSAGTRPLMFGDDLGTMRSDLRPRVAETAVALTAEELFDQIVQSLPASVRVRNFQNTSCSDQ